MLDSSFLLSRIAPAWGWTVGKMHPFLVVSERVRVSSGEGAPGPGRLPPSGFRQLFLFCWLKLFLYCGDVTGGFWGPEKLGQPPEEVSRRTAHLMRHWPVSPCVIGKA